MSGPFDIEVGGKARSFRDRLHGLTPARPKPGARRLARLARRQAEGDTRRKRTPKEKAARREFRRLKRAAKQPYFLRVLGVRDIGQRSAAATMRFLFAWARAMGREPASRIAAGVLRTVGPLTKENRIARANIAAAFPEKNARERERILSGSWEALARLGIEYAFLGDLVEAFDENRPTGGVIEHVGIEHAYAFRDAGKAGIIFGAHIGNFEMTAAIGAKIGLPVVTLFRPPTNPYVAEEMERRRNQFISKLIVSGRGAAIEVAAALRSGKHLGIVVDQRIRQGPLIDFLGRPSHSNPIVGALARLFECPVIGAHSVRLPGGRYRVEVTPPLVLPRDARGRIDALAVNRMVHGIVADWVREAPDQWLWQHDRWKTY